MCVGRVAKGWRAGKVPGLLARASQPPAGCGPGNFVIAVGDVRRQLVIPGASTHRMTDGLASGDSGYVGSTKVGRPSCYSRWLLGRWWDIVARGFANLWLGSKRSHGVG